MILLWVLARCLLITTRMSIITFNNLKPYIMRNLLLFFSALILGTSGVMAMGTVEDKVAERNAYRYNDSFIFVENGITFSVYPDGEFDFYIDNRVTGRRNGVTFNSGYDYSPYAQYDDYGAVVQVENVPIYYDYYGRVTQVGDVDIRYNNNRVRSVGGMSVFYNRRGLYDYHTGYINVYNRHYVYRPFHAFFARPIIGFNLVFNKPYRRFYSPVRYTYYNPYRYNTRRAYAKIGNTHRYNKVRSNRSKIYRNDNRVTVRSSASRNNRSVSKRNNNAIRTNRAVASNRGNITRRTASRSSATRKGNSNTKVTNRSSSIRSRTSSPSNNRAVTSRSIATRKPANTTVNKRTVMKSPRNTSVTRRSSTTYKSPQTRTRTASRSVRQAPSQSRSSVSTRSSRSTVSKAPSRSRSNTASRASSTRSSSRRY